MQFVIFHGSFGNPKENWFPWLKEELEKLGQDVLSPQFPIDTWERVTELGQNHSSEIQNLKNWTETFEKEVLPKIENNEPLCLIGHSLATVFMLHVVDTYNIQLDSAIFVAPFFEFLGRNWQIDAVNASFYKNDFDFNRLKKLIPISYAFISDNDPYVPEEKANDFAEKLGSQRIIVKDAGHFNNSSGFITFPQLLDLCKKRISQN